jgi:hypothetical protein
MARSLEGFEQRLFEGHMLRAKMNGQIRLYASLKLQGSLLGEDVEINREDMIEGYKFEF